MLFSGADSLITTNIVRSLLKGDSGAKKYSRLLRAVGRRHDGSRGIQFWDSLDQWHYNSPHADHCSPLQQPFGAVDNGTHLQLLLTPRVKLIDLSEPVLERIFDLALPTCNINIADVEKDTSFHNRVIYMKRWLCYRYGRWFSDREFFKQVLATSSTNGQFPGVFDFRNILRKTWPHKGIKKIGRSCKEAQ
jgi:hypothetical protein